MILIFYVDFYQFLCDDSSPTSSALLREISEELFNQDIMVDVSFEMICILLLIILSLIPIYSTSISVSISFRNPSSSSFDFLNNFSEIDFFILSFLSIHLIHFFLPLQIVLFFCRSFLSFLIFAIEISVEMLITGLLPLGFDLSLIM